MTLLEIESLTKAFAMTRKLLYDRMQELEEELSQVKKRHLMGIKKAVAAAASWQSKLKNAIDESPELFRKPRTVVIYGVRIGYMKQRGKLFWDDDDIVVRLIKKHFPDQFETLVKIIETPVKSSLSQLSVADLKKIGVTVEETGEEILIKPVDSEVDKLVERLLSEELQEAKKVAS